MNDKEVNKYIGSKIKEYRKQKGITQKELADLVGLKNSGISNYEQGTRIPKRDFLFKVANALNVSIDDFFPKTGNANTENFSIIDKTVETMKQLDESRQQVVLATANVQLKEQNDSKAKVIPMKKKSNVLTDEALQEAVDTAVAFDGIPLNEQEKEAAKALIRRFWEEDHPED